MAYLRGVALAPLVAAFVCLGDVGMAQDRDHDQYVYVSGLFVTPRDAEWSVPGFTFDTSMKNGFGILATYGRRLPSGLQVELELGYREYDFDRGSNTAIHGSFSSVSFMVNGIYSFDAMGFRPYAGLGLGSARHTAEIKSFTALSTGATLPLNDTGEADVFACQGLAGIAYPLSDRTEARLGYRYFATTDGDFGSNISISSANHNFEVGLLYRF